jgi:hypothetical protein
MWKLGSNFEKAYTSAAYPYGVMNFIPALGIRFRITNNRTRWRCNFKWLSKDGGRTTNFSENLRASLTGDLSNETTISQIHLAGKYL